MTLLSNQQIRAHLEAGELKISRNDEGGGRSVIGVQPSSVDLTVGRIFVPPRNDDDDQMVKEADGFYILKQGGSVLVTTREKICLPSSLAGIMLPKNGHFALKGVSVTNFGHVDPGFDGYLRYTIINMGRDDFRVEVGLTVAHLLIFKLEEPAKPDWTGVSAHSASSHESHARVLSRDFLSISDRIETVTRDLVDRAMRKRDHITAYLTPLVAAVLFAGSIALGFYMFVSDKLYSQTNQLGELKAEVSALKDRLKTLEDAE